MEEVTPVNDFLWEGIAPTIPLVDLIEGARSFFWELPMPEETDYWGMAYRWTSPLAVEAEASRRGEGVVVTLTFSAKAITACSRCLAPTPLAIEGKVRYFYSLRGDDHGEVEFDEDQIIHLDRSQREIDLTAPIQESLILSLPAAALCREDCRGLCPCCGFNLNQGKCACPADTIDPRLEAFRELEGLRDEEDSPKGGN
jgi:uncharacterized protein